MARGALIDAAATRELFDDLDFRVMNSGSGFNHADRAFVLSPKGLWAATLSGPPSKEELSSAHRRALAADDRTAPRRLGAWLIRPEAWIVLACAGFGVSLVAAKRVLELAPSASQKTLEQQDAQQRLLDNVFRQVSLGALEPHRSAV